MLFTKAIFEAVRRGDTVWLKSKFEQLSTRLLFATIISRNEKIRLFEFACGYDSSAACIIYSPTRLHCEDVWNLALYNACKSNCMSNVKWIIEELRDIPIDWMGLIRRWMLIGAIIRAVFEGIRDYIDISYGYILMGALAVYYFMVFFRLLYVYSDKNIQIIINNALTSACAQGNIEMVTYLADKCVHDVNYDFKPELDAASMCGNLRVIDFLKGRFKNAQDNDYYVVVHPV